MKAEMDERIAREHGIFRQIALESHGFVCIAHDEIPFQVHGWCERPAREAPTKTPTGRRGDREIVDRAPSTAEPTIAGFGLWTGPSVVPMPT